MITCAARNPEGKRERRSYIKRALAVMLCCVFVVGLMPPPRAKATAAVGAIAASGAVESFGVLSGIGTLLLTAAGVDFNNGYLTLSDSLYYGSTSYDSGYELWKWVQETKAENQAMFDWFSAVHETVTAAGGFQAGQTFDVPAEVLEGARAWAVQHYDFSSGAITVTQNYIASDNGSVIVFSSPVIWSSSGATIKASDFSFGTTFKLDDTFSLNGVTYTFKNTVSTYVGRFTGWASVGADGSYNDIYGIGSVITDPTETVGFLGYYDGSLRFGYWWGSFDRCSWCEPKLGVSVSSVLESASTLTGSDVLGVPVTEDLKVKVPDVPMTQVGAVTLPVVGALTREDVLVGTLDPDVPAESAVPTTAPAEGDKVGDIALEDVAAAQPSLSAVFVSKFPFCIPWDFVQAVKLLASSPKAPVIEFDPLAKLEPLFGGRSRGDTTVTLDMSDYEYLGGFCRWITTIMFCAALIGLTKKLIWTA